MTQMDVLRIVSCVALSGTLWGCSGQVSGPGSASAVVNSPVVAYDGHYEGTVRFDSSASGFTPEQCATNPRMSFQVRNGQFSYSQPHPHAGNFTDQESTATYTVTIAPDGTVHGTSGDLAQFTGRMTGTRMTGQMNGIICYYTFSADRA
jgi:hypothetical protein